MTGERIAVLDACVLVQAPLRDTLLRLAESPRLYMPMWSAEILIEMKRALEKSIGLSRSKATYLEREMSRHFPAVATSPWGVEALGPAAFLEELYLAAPMIVTERIEAQALNLARTLHTQLDVLAKAVPSFVEVIRRDLGPRGYRPQA